MTKLTTVPVLAGGFVLVLVFVLGAQRWGEAQETFSPYVDARGRITIPPDYRRRWVFLGHLVH